MMPTQFVPETPPLPSSVGDKLKEYCTQDYPPCPTPCFVTRSNVSSSLLHWDYFLEGNLIFYANKGLALLVWQICFDMSQIAVVDTT
jgi:hypothetical protein